MPKLIRPNGDSYTDYKGTIVGVQKSPMTITSPSGETKDVVFEKAFRAPGVRLIIPSKDGSGLVMTREHRLEHKEYDYRLPGGKVIDSLDDFIAFKESGDDILVLGRKKAIEEALQEAGVIIKNLNHYVTARAGGTIEWDLQYWVATDWEYSTSGQELEHGEDIKPVEVPFNELLDKIKRGEMKEYQSIGVLARWMAENDRIMLA